MIGFPSFFSVLESPVEFAEERDLYCVDPRDRLNHLSLPKPVQLGRGSRQLLQEETG